MYVIKPLPHSNYVRFGRKQNTNEELNNHHLTCKLRTRVPGTFEVRAAIAAKGKVGERMKYINNLEKQP